MNITVLLGMQLNCNKQFKEHGKLIDTPAIQKRATGKRAGSHVDVRYRVTGTNTLILVTQVYERARYRLTQI